MKIILSKEKSICDEGITRDYSYRITETDKKIGDLKFFGIEIERRDYLDGALKTIQRDGEKIISPDYDFVENILNRAYENVVSPIHFIEIFGEDIDKEYFKL